MSALEKTDKAIYDLIQAEIKRFRDGLELIPSDKLC